MKNEPTDIDREAARLFTVGRGMTYGRECAGAVAWNVSHGQDVEADAIDTDDPATVGVMLAQVEAACSKPVDLLWRRTRAGCVEYVAEWFDPVSRLIKTPPGPTRGAAIVAAMRQIKR